MELSGSNIRKFLAFWKMKLFYILGNGNPNKISYIFSKEKFPYISGNGNQEQIFYISGGTSKAPKTKISCISTKINYE